MATSQFNIDFDFAADQGHLKIRLIADVEMHQSKVYYVVKDLRRSGQINGGLLPDIQIRKKHGRWVHTDSEKSSELSEAVGLAIEEHLKATSKR